MKLSKNELRTVQPFAPKLMVAGLLVLAACSQTAETPQLGLSLLVRAPQNPDDNPFNLPEAAFVVLTAEGVNAAPSVQPYHPGMKLDLSNVPFGAGRQVRVEVWQKNESGQPIGPVLGRGMSAPIDVAAGGAAQTRHPYVTRINRFAPAMPDDGSTSTLDSGGAGQCAVTLPAGQILFIGGAAGKSGVKDPYSQANWTNFSPSAVGYDPDSRGTILLSEYGAKLNVARAFHSCAVGLSAVAVVGGLVADDKGNPVPTKLIEYFDMTVAQPGPDTFRQVATGTPECPSCTTGLVFARSGASVVRMFEDDNYFLILGGKGDDATFPCLDGAKNEVACAANTWEVWHPKRGNLAQGLLNKARWNHAAVRIPTPTGGYALLIGGENESGPLADFEVLQFNSKGQVSSKNSNCPDAGPPTCVGLDPGLWKPLTTAMPTTRVLPGAAYVTSPIGTKPDKLYNYVVIAGGFKDAAKTQMDNTIDVFDIIGGGYKNEPGTIQMIMGRGSPMVAVVTSGSRAGQVLIAGGTTKLATGDTPVDAEFLFFTDGAVNKDIVHPVENSLGGSRTLGNAVALSTGHVLIGGGVDVDNLAARTSLLLWNPY